MGVRSTGRKLAMQLLYQKDIHHCEINDLIERFFSNTNYLAETKDWATQLSLSVEKHVSDCDELIRTYAIDWDLERIALIDKNILRIAIYELLHTKTPSTVILNEAIEMAKKYASDESPKFINGILDKIVKKVCLQE